jgi:UDP-N-acetylglucosamine 4,6-dehydratase
MDLHDRSILVTGGTGSFGQKFVETVLRHHPEIRRLVIFSRDELKQWQMQQRFSESRYPGIRYFIGDVRDERRISRAMEGIDTVIHAAALKQVPAAEYNPMECIHTNVMGAENVINACLDNGVRRIVALSTDKAAAPINLYGATKLCSDKLFVSANNIRGSRDCRFGVVRYGNVLGSRGSVVPFFLEHRRHGWLPITDERMTRFNITLEQGVQMVLETLENLWGGEIVVPRIPSYRIGDVAKAVAPDAERRMVGIRPGEKVHEQMITFADAPTTVDCGTRFAILPSIDAARKYAEKHKGKLVPAGFSYDSEHNGEYLDAAQIRAMIRNHVDPSFVPGVGTHALEGTPG